MTFVVQGTHKAELEGIPATGNYLDSAPLHFRLKDGLVVEVRSRRPTCWACINR